MVSSSTASAGGTFKCDYRFDDGGSQRTLFGLLTGGAEVNVYINFYDANGALSLRHLEEVVSVGSSVYTSATQTFSLVLNGPIEEIEVRRVGTSGGATVMGIL